MCDPVSLGIAAAAVGAVGAGASFAGANRAADDNLHAANRTAASSFNALETRRTQQDAQHSEDSVTALIDAAAARGRISASASDFGGDASTITQQVNAADFGTGRVLAIGNLNAQNAAKDIASAKNDNETRRVNQIGAVKGASPLSLALGISSAALSGANTYSSAGGRF